MQPTFDIADVQLRSRLFTGSGLFPSPQRMRDAVLASGSEVLTVSVRRQAAGNDTGDAFFELVRSTGAHILPNTAGCRSAGEAVTTARMAREIFGTHWVKLEVIGDDYTLQPDTAQTVEAARTLVADGFEVFPYTTEDLIVAQRLVEAGCRVVMPWGSPIGSGQGLLNPFALETLRARLPDTILVVDAGIGRPSDAARAMELGYDAVLVNSAIALASEPEAMAAAFRDAVVAGRAAWEAGIMEKRDLAAPSTPVVGTPFWQGAPQPPAPQPPAPQPPAPDFKPMDPPIGVYPIVDRLAALETLVEAGGADVVQLRMKSHPAELRAAEVPAAIALGREHGLRLFINDDWELALEHKAYGVHLGQDDIAGADLDALRTAGLRLGLSTHDQAELDRALALRPSYVAIGTVFQTESKQMDYTPLLLGGFGTLCAAAGSAQVVAIGGIKPGHTSRMVRLGASGLACISAVSGADDPGRALADWQREFRRAWARQHNTEEPDHETPP